jgi:hypothetical protein
MTTKNIEAESERVWQWESQEGRAKEWHSVRMGGPLAARSTALSFAAQNSIATGNVRLVRVDTQTYLEESWTVPAGIGTGAQRTDLNEDEEAALKDPATIAAVNASQADPGRRPRRPLS